LEWILAVLACAVNGDCRSITITDVDRYGREHAVTEYLTTQEVAAALRTPAETVRYWRHIGKGPKSFKVGRRVLYAVEDVEAFVEEARIKSGA